MFEFVLGSILFNLIIVSREYALMVLLCMGVCRCVCV